MSPLVQRSDDLSIDPGPAGLRVGKRPLDAAIGEACYLILVFLVDDYPSLATCPRARSGWTDPSGDGKRCGHAELRHVSNLNVGGRAIERDCSSRFPRAPTCPTLPPSVASVARRIRCRAARLVLALPIAD